MASPVSEMPFGSAGSRNDEENIPISRLLSPTRLMKEQRWPLTTLGPPDLTKLPELRAYKLGKHKCSYNQIGLDIMLPNVSGGWNQVPLAEAVEVPFRDEFDKTLLDSSLRFALCLQDGSHLDTYATLVFSEPEQDTDGLAPSHWTPVTRSSCSKGCRGPILRGLQRFGKNQGLPRLWKSPQKLYIAIDEASTHMISPCSRFRLHIACFNKDQQLVGSSTSRAIKVAANNDAPHGSAHTVIPVYLKGYQGLDPSNYKHPGPLRAPLGALQPNVMLCEQVGEVAQPTPKAVWWQDGKEKGLGEEKLPHSLVSSEEQAELSCGPLPPRQPVQAVAKGNVAPLVPSSISGHRSGPPTLLLKMSLACLPRVCGIVSTDAGAAQSQLLALESRKKGEQPAKLLGPQALSGPTQCVKGASDTQICGAPRAQGSKKRSASQLNESPDEVQGLEDGDIYSRKDHSLVALCRRFFEDYASKEGHIISLEALAVQLGVTKRRVYDIVGVLESVQVVQRQGKNKYIWQGASQITQALKALKAAELVTMQTLNHQALDEDDTCGLSEPSGTEPAALTAGSSESTLAKSKAGPADPKAQMEEKGQGSESSCKSFARQARSLRRFSERIVQLFLADEDTPVAWERAAETLLGPAEPRLLQRRGRRLYDITNILAALHLIEKVNHEVPTSKPMYRWLGPQAVVNHLASLTAERPRKAASAATKLLYVPASMARKQPRPLLRSLSSLHGASRTAALVSSSRPSPAQRESAFVDLTNLAAAPTSMCPTSPGRAAQAEGEGGGPLETEAVLPPGQVTGGADKRAAYCLLRAEPSPGPGVPQEAALGPAALRRAGNKGSSPAVPAAGGNAPEGAESHDVIPEGSLGTDGASDSSSVSTYGRAGARRPARDMQAQRWANQGKDSEGSSEVEDQSSPLALAPQALAADARPAAARRASPLAMAEPPDLCGGHQVCVLHCAKRRRLEGSDRRPPARHCGPPFVPARGAVAPALAAPEGCPEDSAGWVSAAPGGCRQLRETDSGSARVGSAPVLSATAADRRSLLEGLGTGTSSHERSGSRFLCEATEPVPALHPEAGVERTAAWPQPDGAAAKASFVRGTVTKGRLEGHCSPARGEGASVPLGAADGLCNDASRQPQAALHGLGRSTAPRTEERAGGCCNGCPLGARGPSAGPQQGGPPSLCASEQQLQALQWLPSLFTPQQLAALQLQNPGFLAYFVDYYHALHAMRHSLPPPHPHTSGSGDDNAPVRGSPPAVVPSSLGEDPVVHFAEMSTESRAARIAEQGLMMTQGPRGVSPSLSPLPIPGQLALGVPGLPSLCALGSPGLGASAVADVPESPSPPWDPAPAGALVGLPAGKREFSTADSAGGACQQQESRGDGSSFPVRTRVVCPLPSRGFVRVGVSGCLPGRANGRNQIGNREPAGEQAVCERL